MGTTFIQAALQNSFVREIRPDLKGSFVIRHRASDQRVRHA
jgi:hypothetical protein